MTDREKKKAQIRKIISDSTSRQRNQIRKNVMRISNEVTRSDFLKLIPDKRSEAVDLRKLSEELNISETILHFWVRECGLTVTADGCVYKDVCFRMDPSESTYTRNPEKPKKSR